MHKTFNAKKFFRNVLFPGCDLCSLKPALAKTKKSEYLLDLTKKYFTDAVENNCLFLHSLCFQTGIFDLSQTLISKTNKSEYFNV